jgi:putative sugar O-methyltransferase
MNSLEKVRALLRDDDIDLESSYWWQERQKCILDVVKNASDPISFIRKIQKNTVSGFDHRVTLDECDELQEICLFKYKILSEDFFNIGKVLEKSEESTFSDPDSIIRINDHRVSNIYLSHLKNFLKATEGIESQVKKVLEIGGGYGSLARIFLNILSPQYFIVDMKISLACAYIFLAENFPKLKIFLQEAEDKVVDFKRVTQEYDVILILPSEKNFSQLTSLKIDLCINVGSLQEMTPERSNFFQEKIFNTLKISRIYLLNYFLTPRDLNKIDHERNIGTQPIVPIIQANWSVKDAAVNDPVWCIDASERNWLEIILEKKEIDEKKSGLNAENLWIEPIESIYGEKQLNLVQYRGAFKFILRFFQILLNQNAASAAESSNMLSGLIQLGCTRKRGASLVQKISNSFKMHYWLNKQIPEIKHMRSRLVKPVSWYVVFIECIEILTVQLRQITVSESEFKNDEQTTLESSLRKIRKGLPSIDLKSYANYHAKLSDTSEKNKL